MEGERVDPVGTEPGAEAPKARAMAATAARLPIAAIIANTPWADTRLPDAANRATRLNPEKTIAEPPLN